MYYIVVLNRGTCRISIRGDWVHEGGYLYLYLAEKISPVRYYRFDEW